MCVQEVYWEGVLGSTPWWGLGGMETGLGKGIVMHWQQRLSQSHRLLWSLDGPSKMPWNETGRLDPWTSKGLGAGGLLEGALPGEKDVSGGSLGMDLPLSCQRPALLVARKWKASVLPLPQNFSLRLSCFLSPLFIGAKSAEAAFSSVKACCCSLIS